jgi:hypothetical protein
MFAERTHSMSDVAPERLQPRQAAPFSIGLAGLLRAAEADEGLTAGFLRAEARTKAVFNVHGQVGFKFGREFLFSATGAQQADEAHAQCTQRGSQSVHLMPPV